MIVKDFLSDEDARFNINYEKIISIRSLINANRGHSHLTMIFQDLQKKLIVLTQQIFAFALDQVVA